MTGPDRDNGTFAKTFNSHRLETAKGQVHLVHRPNDAPAGTMPVIHGHTHANPDEMESVSVDKTEWSPITLSEVWLRIKACRNSLTTR